MAWQAVDVLEQRTRFVMEATQAGVSMTVLCRRFGISRKTGYKWRDRFRADGLAGLGERSRRPRQPRYRLSAARVRQIVKLRQRYPHWGAKKLQQLLPRGRGARAVPACSTIGEVLRRQGLIHSSRRRRRRVAFNGGVLRTARRANDVWAVDFKGRFRLGNGRWCEPLTISDVASRYVLAVQGLPDQRVELSRRVFVRLFRQQGLPRCIRCDNGGPFASKGAGGLSRLSAWWQQLGIVVEWITPGHPEQNGVHERMHRTLKQETASPPAGHPRAQQTCFNRWRNQFNQQRPHEALGMAVPAQRYRASQRRYPRRLPVVTYSAAYAVRRVRSNGEIKWRGQKQFIGQALAGLRVGLREIQPRRHAVYFMKLLLGELSDQGRQAFQPIITRPRSNREKIAPLGGQ